MEIGILADTELSCFDRYLADIFFIIGTKIEIISLVNPKIFMTIFNFFGKNGKIGKKFMNNRKISKNP